jgi:hypothetical protein
MFHCHETVYAADRLVLPKLIVWDDKGIRVELPLDENKTISIKGTVLPIKKAKVLVLFKLTF